MRKIISTILALTLTSQLFSCGYVLHPDRRGQKNSDRIDWAIVGLDAIGLIFFIVPGVIAYAVDIYSGTIYLKKTMFGYSAASADGDWSDVEIIKMDPKKMDDEAVAHAIEAKTGVKIDLTKLKIYDSKGHEFANKLLEEQKAS